jgi:AraC-like DNA-binding protein
MARGGRAGLTMTVWWVGGMKGFFIRWVVLALMLSVCSCSSSLSDHERRIIDFSVCYNQDPDQDAVREKGQWINKDISRLFKLPYEMSEGLQYAWIRAEFSVKDPENIYGITLGRIYVTDRVFVNGILCGERGEADIGELHYPRNYSIPKGLLKKERNELLIYIGMIPGGYGGVNGDVKLLNLQEFKREKLLGNLFYLYIPIGIFAMLLGIFANEIVHSISEVKNDTVLVVIGIISVWLVHLFTLFSPFQFLSLISRTKVLWICSAVNGFLFILFLQVNFRVLFKGLTKSFLAFQVVSVLFILFFGKPGAGYETVKALGATNIVLTNILAIYFFIRIRKKMDPKTKILFALLAFVPAELIGVNILNYLYGTHGVPYIHIYGIPFMMFLIIILNRAYHLASRRKLETLKLKLMEMNAELGEDDRKSVVTAQVKRKLNGLTVYIKENFNLHLTRENLAERVELSPDYLGRMFKSYTGKKINDYINDIRITEACRMLKESDEKIIDIAFNVGFESLVTFNRAFMKSRNTSPTDYRQSFSAMDGAGRKKTLP